MNIIDAARMQAVTSYPDLVEWLRESHLETIDAMEDLLMTQPAAAGGADTLLIRAAWQRGSQIGVKLITVFPANAGGALPSIQAVYLLFDGASGEPLASLDGTELTYWKTAADSALGARFLTREDAASLCMVGAGAQAPHLIRAHCSVRPSIERVAIWNRTHAKAEALAAAAPVDGVTFEATADLEAACRGGRRHHRRDRGRGAARSGRVAAAGPAPGSRGRIQARDARGGHRGVRARAGVRRRAGDHRRHLRGSPGAGEGRAVQPRPDRRRPLRPLPRRPADVRGRWTTSPCSRTAAAAIST